MAQTNATNTGEFAGFLRPDAAEDYFKKATYNSSVMQLARKVPLGINGQEITFSTGKAAAAWVAEAGQKPATKTSLGLRSFKPHKIAAISVVSAEVVRANPGNYMEILKDEIAVAFAEAFDAAVLHGTNTPFGAYIDQTTKSVELGTTTAANGGTYGDVVAGLKLLADDKKKLSGFAFDSVVEPTFLGSTDTSGRPLFIDTPLADTTSVITPGRLIGRPAFLGDGISTEAGIVGYGGDWSQLVWGSVGGITYDVSTQTAVTIGGTLTSLWEHNLVAIRAEAEYGVLINDVDAFVKYANAV
ncbi:phage major capsid protein [Arthrobacter sp. MDT1-65]